jgi:SAM-dependent methyltransferase
MSPLPDLNTRNKTAWEQLYASTADPVWGRAPVGFLARHLPKPAELPAGDVLDAATGEGRNLPPLLALGRAVVACDASPAALAKIPAAIRARIETLTCDLAGVPAPDGRFAFILLSDVVETLPDAAVVLREMRRLLAPGGLLLANIPDEDDGVAGVEMVATGDHGWLYRDRYYYRFHSRAQAEALFRAAALDVVSCGPCAWEELPHPEFRDATHTHRSLVLIARRPA